MTDEECFLVRQADPSLKNGLFPPWCLAQYPASGIDYRRDSGIAATGNPTTGLDSPQGSVRKVLPVTGSVSPPSIVGNDRQCVRTVPDIVSAELPVDRLITNRATNLSSVIFKTRGLPVTHTTAHHSSKPIVDRTEKLGIRGHLNSHNKLILMVSLYVRAVFYH